MDVEIKGSKKTIKSVSLRLETQADAVRHVGECYSQDGGRGFRPFRLKEIARNRSVRHRVTVTKHTVLPTFVFICKLLRDL